MGPDPISRIFLIEVSLGIALWTHNPLHDECQMATRETVFRIASTFSSGGSPRPPHPIASTTQLTLEIVLDCSEYARKVSHDHETHSLDSRSHFRSRCTGVRPGRRHLRFEG